MNISNSDFTPVSEIQHYLIKLMQECNELSHVVSKVLEFGVESCDPTTNIKNIDAIQKEFNDILGVAKVIDSLGLPMKVDDAAIQVKIDKMTHYAAVSRKAGMLSQALQPTVQRIHEAAALLTDLSRRSGVTVNKVVYNTMHYPEIVNGIHHALDYLTPLLDEPEFLVDTVFDPEVRSKVELKITCNGDYTELFNGVFLDYLTDSAPASSYLQITLVTRPVPYVSQSDPQIGDLSLCVPGPTVPVPDIDYVSFLLRPYVLCSVPDRLRLELYNRTYPHALPRLQNLFDCHDLQCEFEVFVRFDDETLSLDIAYADGLSSEVPLRDGSIANIKFVTASYNFPVKVTFSDTYGSGGQGSVRGL